MSLVIKPVEISSTTSTLIKTNFFWTKPLRIRGIELFSAATFFSMNDLVEKCEKFLEASNLRYPLQPESLAVLMKVALEASDLNLKKPDKRSILKINNVPKAKVKKASQEDIMHEHCYVDPPPPQKRRKLRRAKIKKATEVVEEECSLQMEVVREHNKVWRR